MSEYNHTVLIGEDEPHTRAALTKSLQSAGFQVVEASDGQATLSLFLANVDTIDIVVLDVLMPRLDGFQVCQAIREVSDVPIILATVLGSSSDRINGLEMGANDYIVKPFSTKELIARMRSILRRAPRRSHRLSQAPVHAVSNMGNLVIDHNTRRVHLSGQLLRLTEIEFRLLELLASRPGHIFSRSAILQALWGYEIDTDIDTKTVDVHISRLRIKLNESTHTPQFIVTIRGRGYMFLVQR